jgi:hypothetical protein
VTEGDAHAIWAVFCQCFLGRVFGRRCRAVPFDESLVSCGANLRALSLNAADDQRRKQAPSVNARTGTREGGQPFTARRSQRTETAMILLTMGGHAK